jgi:YD repeat-containing protein
VAHYAYSADHGGMTMELQPPPTLGAARPLKLYDYVQRQAYVLNGVGQLVASSTPVWLPSTETQCQTVANFGPGAPSGRPACDASEQKTVITYEYGTNGSADNLLLRGKVVTADGQSRRTCMVYDARGNKIAETTPRAGLTTCS